MALPADINKTRPEERMLRSRQKLLRLAEVGATDRCMGASGKMQKLALGCPGIEVFVAKSLA